MELLQRLTGVDSQFAGELVAGAVEGRQGFSLAARSVPGEHQLAPGVFSQRMLRHQRFELADQIQRVGQGEVGVDALLECRRPQVVQPPTPTREGCVGEILERRSPGTAPSPSNALRRQLGDRRRPALAVLDRSGLPAAAGRARRRQRAAGIRAAGSRDVPADRRGGAPFASARCRSRACGRRWPGGASPQIPSTRRSRETTWSW